MSGPIPEARTGRDRRGHFGHAVEALTARTKLSFLVRGRNVARAAGFLHAETRARYQTQLARLSAAARANIDQHMTTIQLVTIGFAGAEYEMLRRRNGQPLSFAVWFQLDQDGLWRLRRF